MTRANDETLSTQAEPAVSRWKHKLLPAVVLLAGVALSLVMSQSAHEETTRTAQARFDTAAIHATVQVERRFCAYVEVLAGLRAMLHTGEVSREAFRRYAEALDLGRAFPGFQVLNYAPQVTADAKEAFEAAQRRDVSLPARDRFAISPPGAREDYHPFTLIEPLAGNEQFLGLDIAAVPAVRAALATGRDTGRLTSSGKLIHNRGPQGQVGLAMRLPVYRPGLPAETPAQRRAAYLGTVGAGFLVTRMLADLPGVDRDVRLRFYDGGPEPAASEMAATPAVQADKLLYDSGARPGAEAQPAGEGLRRVDSFALGGRLWVVEVLAPAAAGVVSFERLLPAIVLVGGIVISTLLAGVLLGLTGSQRRAVALARDMTRSLRTSEQRLAEAQGLAKLGSWTLDIRSGEIECSDEARRIYGVVPPAAGLTLPRLLAMAPKADRAALESALKRAEQFDAPVELEHALHARDGADRWLHLNLQRSSRNGATAVNATVSDETARKKAAMRLELAHDIACQLAAEDEPDSAVAYILSSIGAQLGWHAAVCWLVGAQGQVSCLHVWTSDEGTIARAFAAAMRRWSEPRGSSLLDGAWTSGNPVWRTIAAAADAHELDRVAGGCGLHASLAIPVNAGSQLAALEFFSRGPISIDREIDGFMRSIGSQLAQYLQRKQAEQALRHVANHDALTGLASRPLLHERLVHAIQRAMRRQTRVAVLFMDLDRFKHINDSLGHSVGDALLRACAQRLGACVRESDTVARFGGDEFVVVLEDVGGTSDVLTPLMKIFDRFSAPFQVGGRELKTTASIGVSMYPDDGQDAETLLMNADAAMYRAKERGASTYEFYAAQLNSQGQQQIALECSLHHALERNELFLVYQPKLDLETGKITGVEALMRWQHPSLGLVPPAQFIPIAEDNGLIEPMGHWALEVACRDARQWQDEGHAVQVSVNLSARQLNRPELVQEVATILAEARLAPGQLELEITESGVMRSPTRAAVQLHELRQLGVSLAIDDFGTGYSSLSYLQRFPLCTLKIDRSFVKDLPSDKDAAALTAGIIGLAQRLRMKVVAEGVETVEQLSFLRAHRCDEIQGYYLSKPINAHEMGRFLACDVRNLVGPMAAA